MTRLRIYAHHGRIPQNFMSATPTTTSTTTPPPPPPIKEYWCELVDQNIVDIPGIGVPGYGMAGAIPPDEWRWDLGYDPTAINFNVTKICILIVDNQQNSYDYTLISPTGQRIPVPGIIVPGPLAPLAGWGNPAAPFGGLQICWFENVPNAKGVWKIEVRQKAGFLGVPTDAAWANGISHVQLHNHPVEGILAVEFEGNEVLPPTTTTTTTSTTTTPRPPTTTPRPPTTTPRPPTTSTTTTTTPPTTTTSTTTTTTSTTTTSSTTPPPPPPILLGCLCLLLVAIALALIGITATTVLAWACSFFTSPLLGVAITTAILGIVLLIIWILLCRACAAIIVLISWFSRLAAAMPLLAALLAILGLYGCAIGALIVGGFFAVVVAVLNWFGRIVGCV
jgi:hypothetical protein